MEIPLPIAKQFVRENQEQTNKPTTNPMKTKQKFVGKCIRVSNLGYKIPIMT